MRDLYLAWRYGRLCPYRVRHGLGDDFRPLDQAPDPETGEVAPRPPASLLRLRSVIVAFCRLAEDERIETAMASAGGNG